MTIPSVSSAVREALGHASSIDIVEGVKAAVAKEFETLDPGIEIRATDYFNHSYVPDFVVKWRDNGRNDERNVYLRYTLLASSLGGDVRGLRSSGPIVLTLRDDEDPATSEEVRREFDAQSNLLITNVPALDEATESAANQAETPLLALVKGNLIRGGRGLIDTGTIDALRSSSLLPVGDDEGVREKIEDFHSVVEQVFTSDAATRLRRAATIVQLGLSVDPQQTLLELQEGAAASGMLSEAEIRVLLPYLLERHDVTELPSYWAFVGGMMSLERLEDMASQLEGLDLTPLVSANLNNWLGRRAGLTAHAQDDAEDLATSDRLLVQHIDGWSIHAKMLSLTLGNWRLHVAARGGKIRGRADSLSARWDELRPALRGFELARVKLEGVVRTVDVSSERDSDVRADVEKISDSLDDNFSVPSATVRAASADGDATVEADFRKMIAVASSEATVGSLSQIAFQLLGHRYPVDRNELERFLPEVPELTAEGSD